ncbi:MAG TPA: class I SAM-dependent methyltransferase [Steroidobacteraceae bacterium]|jgi:SAM-dependent methyltransferase|nr:class I SAM-dependent methyltransferase [Steroidobacteraceae bacterium]
MSRQAAAVPAAARGLLGDTADRDYSHKLRLFNAFAAPELTRATLGLALRDGMRILDAGCGTGEVLQRLREAAGPHSEIIGIDLSAAHVRAAREIVHPSVTVLQADLMRAPLAPASFELIWSANTINHLRDPVAGLQRLTTLLRPRGRIAIGQTSLLPELYFAWDSRLERLTREAVRRYYEDRYDLRENDLAGARNLLGWMHGAGLRNIAVRTLVIERAAPLGLADREYLLEAIFRGTWGERLQPYLPPADYAALCRLCTPEDPAFALRRADFHFIQTFTLAVGATP